MRPRNVRSRSIVLLSGGLDSAANLAFCVKRDEPVFALTALYGQRAAVREREAALALSRHFGIAHECVDLSWLGALGGSSLTTVAQSMPTLAANELDDLRATRESARAVWVPNRNGVLIHVAAAYAERVGAGRVVVGFNREEAATFPDNSAAFILASNRALGFSTATGVEVFSYTVEWDKREIVSQLRDMDAEFPFHLIWSCYEGGTARCGRCESCMRFARAVHG